MTHEHRTCLGHLARVYRRLDEDRVVAALRKARSLPHVQGTAEDALGDIKHYLPREEHAGCGPPAALVLLTAQYLADRRAKP